MNDPRQYWVVYFNRATNETIKKKIREETFLKAATFATRALFGYSELLGFKVIKIEEI